MRCYHSDGCMRKHVCAPHRFITSGGAASSLPTAPTRMSAAITSSTWTVGQRAAQAILSLATSYMLAENPLEEKPSRRECALCRSDIEACPDGDGDKMRVRLKYVGIEHLAQYAGKKMLVDVLGIVTRVRLA